MHRKPSLCYPLLKKNFYFAKMLFQRSKNGLWVFNGFLNENLQDNFSLASDSKGEKKENKKPDLKTIFINIHQIITFRFD